MLSSIGRAAVQRVVAGGSVSTNRALQSTWQLQRVVPSKRADHAASRSHVLFLSRRLYATTTKAAPKPKSKATTTAKPKASKTPAKKAVKKAAKKKPVKKRPVLKKKPVKKPAKVLTEEQKTKATIKQLKATALKPPKQKPYSAWSVYIAEQPTNGEAIGLATKRFSPSYKTLSPSELETLNHTANQNKADNEIAYKKWVESHTPDEIRLANNARSTLRSKFKLGAFHPIIDPRQPKKAVHARLWFIKDRYASGDFKGIPFTEANALIRAEFNALSPSELKVYEDRAKSDVARYAQEVKAVFNREVERR